MLSPKLKLSLVLTIAIATVILPVALADNENKQNWKDQETWMNFTDKERASQSRPRSNYVPDQGSQPQVDRLVVPKIFNEEPEPEVMGGDAFSVPGYVIDPNLPAYTRPTTYLETTIIPQIAPQAVWNSPTYLRPRLSHPPCAPPIFSGNWYPGRPLGAYVQTRVIQSGPSKRSGNYYLPSTADPTYAGNYYTNSGPKIYPIIQNKSDPPKDYWGRQGNPFPQ